MGKHSGGRAMREAGFLRYMDKFRGDMGHDTALLIAEYDRVNVAPFREWASLPWYKRPFCKRREATVRVPEDDIAPEEVVEPPAEEPEEAVGPRLIIEP